VSRNHHVCQNTGLPIKERILRAIRQIDHALLFSTFIMVCAFIPLFAMTGPEGQLFGPMAETYAFALGGALVLATILMATFYAPRESRLYKSWGLRWGLLGIGALSFMHVFLLWSGPLEDLPFGEIEGVNLSDPSLLTEMYGWTVLQMVDRYVRLGTFCLAALLALYVWGLVSAYLRLRRSPAA